MDDLLRGKGFWPIHLLVFGAAVPFLFVDDEEVFRGLTNTLALAASPLALRAAGLRADARLGPPPGWRARTRAFLLRWRWLVAAAWGAFAVSGYEKYGNRLWLSALAGGAAFASAAYAARPMPPAIPPVRGPVAGAATEA